MKINQKLIAALVCMSSACLASCKKDFISYEPQTPQGKACTLTVDASLGAQTKVTGTSDAINAAEKTVSTLQVLVFRKDGLLDAYAKSTSASLSMTCTEGERTVYAIVNGADMSSVSTKAALDGKVLDLSENAPNKLVMMGSRTVTLPSESAVTVDVVRFVSRIVINKISRNFESAALGAQDFQIKRIYVSNAAGTVDYAKSKTPSKWYNAGDTKTDLEALLSDSLMSVSVANTKSYSTPHYFYTLPNSSASTKLVIEAVLGGKTYYYPVTLPALESNKSYEIAGLTVKRPGADQPGGEVSSQDVTFGVNVIDWTTVPVSEQII